VLKAAGALAAGESQPVSDGRGPAEYKRAMVRTLTIRALKRALDLVR
jgi:carbon-monoxide dehydrogenase medium subunit